MYRGRLLLGLTLGCAGILFSGGALVAEPGTGRAREQSRQPTPNGIPIIELTDIKEIAAGSESNLALDANGKVWTWQMDTPQPATGLDDVKSVATGDFESLAVRSDGTVWQWFNYDPYTLHQVDFLANIVSIAVAGGCFGHPDNGSALKLALDAEGIVWAWYVGFPEPLIADVKAIAAGGFESLALRSDGTVWTWPNADPHLITQVASLADITEIALGCRSLSGTDLKLTLDADGRVRAWLSGSPQLLPGIYSMTAIASGDPFGFFVRSDGTVWTWTGVPVQLPDLLDIAAVSGAGTSSLALDAGGFVRPVLLP